MKLSTDSLYVRLILLCAAGSTLSVFALGGYVAYEQGIQATNTAYQHAQDITTGLAASLAEDMVMRNYAGIDETLQQASTSQELKGFLVANANGKVIVESRRDQQALTLNHDGKVALPAGKTLQSRIEGHHIVTWVPIVAGDLVGWVRSDLSLENIAADQRRVLMDTGLVALFAVVLSILIATVALRRTIQEIRAVAQFAISLPEKHNQTLQLEPQSAEMRHLVSALNSAASQMREQDMALVTLNRDFITLLQSSSDFIYFKDRDSRIRFCSQTLADITGHKSWRDMIGKHDREIFPEETARIYSEEELPVFRDGIAIINRIDPYLDQQGNRGWVSTSKWPVFAEDGKTVIGIFGISRDVTEQKKAETELMEGRDLAEHLAQVKSEFLANMSHEIRTPMNGIIGLSQLALNQQTTPELRDYLQKISSSSQSLLGILNDILDFSKLEAGRMEIENTPFDLDIVLNNLRNLVEERAHAKHLEFEIEIAEDTPRDLTGDAMRLQQILLNLLGNAIKFTSTGHVTLKIGVMQSEGDQIRLRFAVEDTGIGIAYEDLDKLFRPFSQVDGSITRQFGGTGLGLAISHNLLKLMGSEFAVTSIPGQGTSFNFELQLTTVTGKKRSTRKRVSHDAGALSNNLKEISASLSGARILVAEDNPINQQVVKEFLTLAGIEVTIANHGQEAIDLLTNGNFDAILMDVHMPVMDGFEATRHIRAQAQYQQLPIIALTAGVTQEERENCLAGGMSDFIAKPVNPELLISTLVKWVKSKTAPVSARHQPGTTPIILIVNDTPEQLRSLASLLRPNYQVKVATSGAIALDIAQRTPPPDLILLDADMPEMNGYEVCRRLDENSGTRDIPVLLFLTDGIIGGQAMADKIGVDGLIEATASKEDLLDTIDRTIRSTR